MIEILEFKTSSTTQNELFKDVSSKLYDLGFVNDKYINALLKREASYPTGLNLHINQQFIASCVKHIAIPHTESQYCLKTAIIYVKNNQNINFKEMINPNKTLKVQHFFFLLNTNKNDQTNLLNKIMTLATNHQQITSLQNGKNTIKNLVKEQS